MKLNEYQQKVDDWIKTHGVRYFEEKTNTLLLVEEVGEFARLIARQYGEQSFKSSENENEIKMQLEDELADILFVTVCLANQMGMDLEKIIQRNFNKKTNRDAERHKNNVKLKP
ncbi:MAG: nucleotide pyrophosphohydrolase [Saprospiraceae bacterium]|nr:nucleotide pyrophosphohydrolase [Saprospiraceae bacterium]